MRPIPLPTLGTKFGEYTYIGGEDRDPSNQRRLNVRCSCGNELYVRFSKLRNGESVRCLTCHNEELRRRRQKHDETASYGRLTYVRPCPSGDSVWRCVCGEEAIFHTSNVTRGLQYQCHSCQKEAKRRRLNGRQGAYNSWYNMKARCLNVNSPSYRDYGGRGIKVHPTFIEFESFYAHVGDRPPKMTLDRIDVNGDYAPGNVRWATDSQQSKNKRKSKAVRISLGLDEA